MLPLVSPMLASSGPMPAPSAWAFEPKLDGAWWRTSMEPWSYEPARDPNRVRRSRDRRVG